MITILMPIFNGIEYIDESVQSILNQDHEDWELLIGINGHPKNSNVYEIARKYEQINSKIRVFDLYDIRGKSNTLNELLKYSNADYIALLDVDDIWTQNKLKLQREFLYKYDVIGSKCVYFGEMNGIVPDIPTGDISEVNFAKCNPVINSSSIIKKELCHWDSNFDSCEDYELWLRLRKNQKKFYNLTEITVKHRIHASSAFNGTNKQDELLKILMNTY
jgi:glycosyltransferase involved in cell wall biosynthesis